MKGRADWHSPLLLPKPGRHPSQACTPVRGHIEGRQEDLRPKDDMLSSMKGTGWMSQQAGRIGAAAKGWQGALSQQ